MEILNDIYLKIVGTVLNDPFSSEIFCSMK